MKNSRKASRGGIERYDLEILLRRPSLRANLPRRVSHIGKDATVVEETTCGVGCIRGKWLQSFANRSSYVFIYGILGSIYGSYYAYFSGVITTLEKRFKISSQTIGIIISAGEVAQVITSFILLLCALKVHKPKVMGLGVLMMIASTVIFTLPHFLYDSKISTYRNNNTVIGRCIEETESCVQNLEGNGPIILLIIAQSLHGIGGSLYLIVGKRYEDKNIEKNLQPSLFSILSVLKSLGPAFGYWLSSISLKVFEYPTLTSHLNITEDDPHWRGAWWLGSLIIGFILIIPGTLLVLFPTTLPKTAVRRIHNQLRGELDIEENLTEKMDKMKAIKRLFIKPTFNCSHYTGIFSVMGFLAYFIFLPKYVETQFRLPASNANLISGSIILMSSAIGIVAANSVITRYRPSGRILASWTVIKDILSVCGLITYLYLSCEANDNEINVMATQHFNTTCGCVNYSFFPVCDNYLQTFTSICHARCTKKLYINETEGLETCNETWGLTLNLGNILEGFCPVDCHSDFRKFIIITCGIAFIFSTGHTSYYWFETRFEEKQGKTMILSTGITLLGFLAAILAPVLFGYILDESCLLWERNCHKTTNCWLYNNENLRFTMNLIAIGFTIAIIIFDLGVWLLVKNMTLFNNINYNTDENDDK